MPLRQPARLGGRKPRDIGSGVVSASITDRGRRWLSLATAHPRVGYVELTGLPAFDERQRGDADAVRAYRALMADSASAFLDLQPAASSALSTRCERPRRGASEIAQRLVLRRHPGHDAGLGLRLNFRGWLRTPALAMITEPENQPPRASDDNYLELNGNSLVVVAPALQAAVLIEVDTPFADGRAAWHLDDDGGAELELHWAKAVSEVRLRIACRLRLTRQADDLPHSKAFVRRAPAESAVPVPAELAQAVTCIHRRALRYVRDCTALQVGNGRRVILTDHRSLPLSWTRDAYWQAAMLLRDGQFRTVEDHLRWLWLDCERPQHTWARSHHANGRRVDEIYQADQQLYPLLELADYRQAVGGLPALDVSGSKEAAWQALVQPVLADLERRTAIAGLLPTEENAADDPVGLPYVLANQILAWHALSRLAQLPEFEDLEPAPGILANWLRTVTGRSFTVDGPSGPLWAYAVDGGGRSVVYHDANDLPTVLAPLWGFCAADEELWQATVRFAFSDRNEAWVPGPLGGLGSRHTPGVWSLGLIQEWVAHSISGRPAAASDGLRRLVGCALADWSLPEASDPKDGRILARHWFAWPGAVLGALALPE